MQEKKTILIVDDESDILELLELELEADGLEVIKAMGGHDAFDLIKNNTKIDVVLSDINMPGGDGIELMQQINRLKTEAKVPKIFFMTAYRPDLRDELVEQGAIDVIFKPFSYQQLIRRIRPAIGIEKIPTKK